MSKHALHNALFVAVFINNIRLATELLKFLLGKKLAALFDFRTLKFESMVFTDAAGNERRVDALISVMTKRGRRVLFLIEHKSTQSRAIFQQLLSYQTVIYAGTTDRVVPVVVSTAKSKWRLPLRFCAPHDDIFGDIVLDFGHLLFDLADNDGETLPLIFPSSYPYMLGVRSLQQLSVDAAADFFRGSLVLPEEKRLKLMSQVVNCLAESEGGFSMAELEEVEASCIKRVGDRVMRTVKIGQEGWLEQGFKRGLAEGLAEGEAKGLAEGEAKGLAEGEAKGLAEGEAKGLAEGDLAARRDIALNMLKQGTADAAICRTTKLSRKEVLLLKKSL